jgi:hypothetical protein
MCVDLRPVRSLLTYSGHSANVAESKVRMSSKWPQNGNQPTRVLASFSRTMMPGSTKDRLRKPPLASSRLQPRYRGTR